MKEETVVRENLMTQEGYTGYCGDDLCEERTPSSPDRWPRTKWIPELNQFKCPKCGWVSQFPDDFINRYKAKWNL
jgi:hypothetical protein